MGLPLKMKTRMFLKLDGANSKVKKIANGGGQSCKGGNVGCTVCSTQNLAAARRARADLWRSPV
jgi:hypothetical protein